MRKIFFIILITIFLVFGAFSSKAFWLEDDRASLVFGEFKKITVFDDGFKFNVNTKASSVEELLKLEKIEVGENDLVFPSLDHEIVPGMNIEIHRSITFQVEADGKTFEAKTFRRSVEEALSDAGITLSHLDKVNYSKKELIQKDMELVVTRIEIEEVEKDEVIEFETVEKNDSDLKWRKEKVKQTGANGLKKVKYKITYKNGKIVSKEVISSEIVSEPITEIISIGTKIEVGDVDKGRASWYKYTGTLACASTKYSKGTWLRVTNQANGKQVIVQVNDYGPMASTGKIIDLDSVAFKKIGNLGQGVLNVKVEEILD